MKVIYTDPDGRAGTYHPALGYLESGKAFELSGDVAGKYIRSGLLKKAESSKSKEQKEEPETINTKTETKKTEVKNNAKSIDR